MGLEQPGNFILLCHLLIYLHKFYYLLNSFLPNISSLNACSIYRSKTPSLCFTHAYYFAVAQQLLHQSNFRNCYLHPLLNFSYQISFFPKLFLILSISFILLLLHLRYTYFSYLKVQTSQTFNGSNKIHFI